ncbi:MAG: hypothetical protein Tsb0015_12720 [Simkaniaceae bacterium]
MDFFEENYFQKYLSSSYEIEKWLESMDNEHLQLWTFLSKHVTDPERFNRLKEQLTWLKFQKDYYANIGNLKNLAEDFNWVVQNFNLEFELTEESKFPYLPKPEKEEI